MKKKLFVFALPLLALGVTSCGGSPSSSSSASESVPSEESSASTGSDSSASQSTGLPQYDPSEVRDSIAIHYHRDDGKYEDWALWIWDHGNGGEGAEYLAQAVDNYGSVFHYPLSTWSPGNWSKLDLGVIVKSKGSWSAKDPDGDRYIVTSDLALDDNGNYSVWLWTGITAIYKTEVEYPYFVSRAFFKNFNTISVASGNGKMSKVQLYKDRELLQTFGPFETAKTSFEAELSEEASMAHSYHIVATYENGFEIENPVDVSTLYESPEFAREYNYDGDDLGAVYTAAKTTFKVWSPFSDAIELRIYDNGTPVRLDAQKGSDEYRATRMVKGEKGVWSAEVEGDLEGKYYTYAVTNYKFKAKEIVDPYAKSAGINGVRGMIVDFSKTNPNGWDSFDKAIQVDPKALTVYETHVADLTTHETWTGTAAARGKFAGAHEAGTKYEGLTTGFDHIKELGVNAVQFQPIFDHANDERPDKYKFNWGYNPLNYNVLEGAYSSDPYDGYARIREFKALVKDYHEAGINVIMDVVYNHVNSVEGLQFDVLAPGYFFRYNDQGGLSNGSGCGNETASDRAMFRKYMLDSTEFWAKEYKLGGFRFDLMALHDLETMDELADKLHEINPSLAVYGEPWTGGGTTLAADKQASQANGRYFEGYAQFNDIMRDALVRSGMKPVAEVGFGFDKWGTKGSLSDVATIRNGLKGITGNAVIDSDKTVNYVSCHDNYTINDRILAYENAKKLTEGKLTTRAERAKMNFFSQSFALASQGISFFLAGEEMLRSKFELTDSAKTIAQRLDYAHNSYNSDDLFDGEVVNALDYSRKAEFPELFANYKALIELKQSLAGLHQSITSIQDPNHEVVYDRTNYNELTSKFVSDGYEYKTVFAAGVGTLAAVDFAGYEMVFDSANRDIALTAETPMEAFEVLIARKAVVA